MEYLSTKGAAAYLGVSKAYLLGAVARGSVEAYDFGVGYKFRREGLDAYAASRKVGPRIAAVEAPEPPEADR
jgi:excisionase family DNA binding protein